MKKRIYKGIITALCVGALVTGGLTLKAEAAANGVTTVQQLKISIASVSTKLTALAKRVTAAETRLDALDTLESEADARLTVLETETADDVDYLLKRVAALEQYNADMEAALTDAMEELEKLADSVDDGGSQSGTVAIDDLDSVIHDNVGWCLVSVCDKNPNYDNSKVITVQHFFGRADDPTMRVQKNLAAIPVHRASGAYPIVAENEEYGFETRLFFTYTVTDGVYQFTYYDYLPEV